ncbi:hypothetical protein DITRI_Ditri12bG0184200 [Diplodiscus trichospermus]
MAGGNFMHRVMSYVINEIVVDRLANSPAFQRFAVRTSKKIEDISSTAARKRQELAEQMKELTKNMEITISVGVEFKSLTICGRYLSNSTASAAENQEKSSSLSKTNSYGTQNAGGSQQSGGDAGKPVRGGPVSWLSFLLLLATGTGIILYYDKNKKRHIEEEKVGIEIVPVFISVDPERDTAEQVCEYVKEFHPKLIGLTGSSDEIKKVAHAYHVYYMKTAEEDSDYLVDHSIVMYLMDPNMEFLKFFGKNNDVDSLTDGVIKEINQHKK